MRGAALLGLGFFLSATFALKAQTPPTQAEIISRQLPQPDYLLLLNTAYPVWIAWGQPEQFKLFDVQRIWLPAPERGQSREGWWQYRAIYRLAGGRSILLGSHPSSDLRPDDPVLARVTLSSGERLTLYRTSTGGLRSSAWGRYPGYFFQSPAPDTPGLPSPGDQTIRLQEALDFVACLRIMDRQTLVP